MFNQNTIAYYTFDGQSDPVFKSLGKHFLPLAWDDDKITTLTSQSGTSDIICSLLQSDIGLKSQAIFQWTMWMRQTSFFVQGQRRGKWFTINVTIYVILTTMNNKHQVSKVRLLCTGT